MTATDDAADPVDGIPPNLKANDLRRVADALEALIELKKEDLELRRKLAAGEIEKKSYHGTRKSPAVWLACELETVEMSETLKFIGWEHVKERPTFRDPDKANMTREHQFRRFARQHLILRTPDYGGTVHFVALGKEDKFGPPAVAREDSLHCAKRAYDKVRDGMTSDEYGPPFDPKCRSCVTQKKREDAEHIGRLKGKLKDIDELIALPGLDPARRKRLEEDRERTRGDLRWAVQSG